MNNHRTHNGFFAKELIAFRARLIQQGMYLSGNFAVAEDLAHEAITKAISSEHQFVPGTNMKAWLLTIVQNTYFTQRRKKQNNFIVDSDGDITNNEHSSLPSPESNSNCAAIDAAIARLLPGHREVIHLVREGYTTEEMATLLGAPLGTIKSRVNRARIALAAQLPKEDLEILSKVWLERAAKYRTDNAATFVATNSAPPSVPANEQALPAGGDGGDRDQSRDADATPPLAARATDPRRVLVAHWASTVHASTVPSVTRGQSRPLFEYPLFADPRNLDTLIALQANGINSRADLIVALEAFDFKRSVVQPVLSKLLHQQGFACRTGQPHPIATCIISQLTLKPPRPETANKPVELIGPQRNPTVCPQETTEPSAPKTSSRLYQIKADIT